LVAVDICLWIDWVTVSRGIYSRGSAPLGEQRTCNLVVAVRRGFAPSMIAIYTYRSEKEPIYLRAGGVLVRRLAWHLTMAGQLMLARIGKAVMVFVTKVGQKRITSR